MIGMAPGFVQLAMHPGYSIWLLGIAWAGLAANGVLIFNKRQIQHPGLIQVRLNAREAVQYSTLSGPNAFREIFVRYGWIAFGCIAAGVWPVYLSSRIDFGSAMILCIGLTIVAIVSAIRAYKFRGNSRGINEGAIADQNRAYFTPTLWKNVSSITFRPLKDDIYRLRLDRRWGRIFTDCPVDAEVRCTEDQAGRLREWMEERIKQARERG
jgi:hypothetical protein